VKAGGEANHRAENSTPDLKFAWSTSQLLGPGTYRSPKNGEPGENWWRRDRKTVSSGMMGGLSKEKQALQRGRTAEERKGANSSWENQLKGRKEEKDEGESLKETEKRSILGVH